MSRFIAASLLVLTSMPLAAQVDRFEVASVRAKGSPEALPLITVEPGGRFVAPNSTLRELVRTAYGIDDNRIVGGPDWMNRERFAIEARAGDPAATGDRVQRMLAALLAERFKLAAHRETRELPVFALRVTRGDGRPASAMRTASAECLAIVPPAGVPPAPPPPPATTGTRPRPLVPANAGLRCPVHFFAGWIAGRAITMAQFAQRLAPFVNRPVVDRTGLGGEFDFELAFTPERPPNPQWRCAAPDVGWSVDLHRDPGTAGARAVPAARPSRGPRHRQRRTSLGELTTKWDNVAPVTNR